MKKGLILIALLVVTTGLFGQNTFKYPLIVGSPTTAGGYLQLNGATSGSSTIQVAAEAGTATFQLPTTNGTNGYVLVTNGSGVTSWSAPSSSMVYPGAGIPLSTGSAWGTSITNNSDNWNTAYGWGNHASAGYLTSETSHDDVVVDGDFTSQGIILRGASAGTYSILTNNSTNWNTAYGWGDHSGLYLPVAGTAASVTGFTPASGSITLTGDLATADDITFYTNGNGEYNLPTGGGNLTIQSQVQGWINDSLDVLRTADSDTIPLFVFGLGSGHSADTALFNNERLAGAFYNSGSDTLYVTELRGVLVEGTGTETIDVQVSWHVNMKDATATNLNITALTITSITTGTADTTFDNNGIPPDTWVWCTLSGASANNKPTMLSLTMTGYRRNRSY